MKKRWKYTICAGMICMSLCMGLTGCKKSEKADTSSQKVFTIGKEKVCLDEVWIYAETVMQGYEQKYGSRVWGIETQDTDGTVRTMEDITRQDIIEDIRCTKLLVQEASTYNVSLTNEEKEDAASQAKDFYNNLTDEQISKMGISLAVAEQAFEENMLADKVYDQVMVEGNVEVSDEEARMTTIYDLCFACYTEDSAGNITAVSDEEKAKQRENAEAALLALDDPENPASYDDIAAGYNLQQAGRRTLSYSDLVVQYGEELVNILYSMENGTHTTVVETEYGYHIIGMEALTDSQATADRKAEMLTERQKEYFATVYQEWVNKTDKKWSYEKDVDQEVYSQIPFGNVE